MKEFGDRHEALFRPDAFPDLVAVPAKLTEIEKEQADFVDGLTEEPLPRFLPVRTGQLSLAHLIQHLVNHSTYHRGQVAVMLRQLGAKPLPTDFHLFLLERSHAAVGAQV